MKKMGFLVILIFLGGCSNIQDSNSEDSIFSSCGDSSCGFGEDSDNCCLDCDCPTGYSCSGY